MPDPYKTPVDMQDVYDEDAQKNKEFDNTLNPDGSFKKPSLEQLKKGSEIKNKILNQVRSTGFEVGANIGLDKATNWLLAAPFPGARLLYGGANFLGSAAINIQAQRIRGEEGIKWGEAGASGGMSLVPYMPFAAGKYTKYLGEPWSVQRGVVGGAVTGVGHEAIRVGIDEKRLPSPIETGLSATVGGAVGGAIPAAADTANKVGRLIKESINDPYNPVVNFLIRRRTGTVGARRRTPPPGPPVQQRIIFGLGCIKGGKLDVDKMRSEGWMGASTGRYTLETFQTRSDQFIPDFFKEEKRRLLPGFINEYGDYLRSKGITEEQINQLLVGSEVNLHHITPLKAGIDLYHGTTFEDAEWLAVTDIFNEFGLLPGAPSGTRPELKNWLYVLQEPHDLLHHEFLKDNIGIQGQIFFTPERKALLRSGIEGRKQVTREYAAIIKRGKDLIEDMMDQFQIAFGQTNPSPERLTEVLHRSLEDGTIPLLEPKYALRSQDEIAEKVIEVSDFVRAQYDEEFIEPIRRSEALSEAQDAAQFSDTKSRIRAEDERFTKLDEDVNILHQDMIKRQGTFTRFSTIEDAREKAEELISKYDTSGQLRVLFADEMTYEATVERLARLLYENPNATIE